jgi:predicted nuclease with TOPRIM domain
MDEFLASLDTIKHENEEKIKQIDEYSVKELKSIENEKKQISEQQENLNIKYSEYKENLKQLENVMK